MSRVGTATFLLFRLSAVMAKNFSYRWIDLVIIDERVGEVSQDRWCIFLMNVPWRMTAPLRSRENG